MVIAIIVQARMASTRLPGKVLKKIFGKTLLEHLISRLKKVKSADKIIVATTTKQRDGKIVKVAKKLGGKVLASYALLGCYDLVFVLDLPDTGKAMKASIELAKATGIGFTTSPAVTVEEFDKIVA